MNVTEFIAKVRLVLDDNVDSETNPIPTYLDAEIVEHGIDQARSLARIQVMQAKGYYNFTMVLPATSTPSIQVSQISQSVWQYALPSWIMQIAGVWQLDTTPESSFSPYTWSNQAAMRPGLEVPRWHRRARCGYSFDDRRHLRLYGFNAAIPLVLNVAKLPPKWFRVVTNQVHASASKLYLPSTFALGTEDTAEGAYINADVQVVSSTVADQFGSVRRVVYSNAANVHVSTRRHELWLTNPFGVATALPAGSTVETAIPITEDHARVLILLTANACLEKRHNLPALRAIAPELGEQLAAFREFATQPDGINGPYFVQSDDTPTTYDTDRAFTHRPMS